MPPTGLPVLDAVTERKLAAGLYNEVWRLMEIESRTAEQTDAMVHAAHASRYHWGRVGTPVNAARGEWLCARVYAVVGRAEPALWHARRCLALLEGAEGAEDWDVAAAYEAVARASALAGDEAGSREWLARGPEAAAAIADPEDRKPIESNLASLG
ncbi:MAG: hypothetical protein ABSD62_00925 [Candidatus Limnocylindrales bacterium]|jgi:hypothetical protein